MGGLSAVSKAFLGQSGNHIYVLVKVLNLDKAKARRFSLSELSDLTLICVVAWYL